MALTKRGRYWHYDFIYKGRRYQGSTDQTNINKAKLVESKIRSDVALESFGIGPPKIAPPFKEFMEGKFHDFVHRHAKAKRTAKFYDEKSARLVEGPLKDLRLSDIDVTAIEKYCDTRRGVSIATLNGELRTLNKALHIAKELKLITEIPKVRQLPGENEREFTVSAELEAAYLTAADYPLRQAAILILDLGIRPEECVALLKTDVEGEAVMIRHGKTVNARRAIPHTDRTKEVVRLMSAVWPDSPYLFPGRKGKHLTRGALDNLHTKLRARLIAAGMPEKTEDFVLYSFRHTFGTKLAESGAGHFEIMKAMGHAKITTSQRYIHLSGEHLGMAMKRKELLDKISRGEITPSDSTTPVSK